MKKNTPQSFNIVAEHPPLGIFGEFLAGRIGEETAQKVIEALKKLQLPLPQTQKEFLLGTEGALIFSNEHGVVIRIEKKSSNNGKWVRVNDNPYIIQPLGSFSAGEAIIEICPGTHTTTAVNGLNQTGIVDEQLRLSGVHYWDTGWENIGILPVTTPVFPKGVPVVIDRLAVRLLSHSVGGIREALERMGADTDPQEQLYGPLRDALAEAWPAGDVAPDAGMMKDFWQMCASSVEGGILVAGWNEGNAEGYGYEKKNIARQSAQNYSQRMKTSGIA